MKIHPTAIVHPRAELADDVEVQAFTIIDEHVQIGAGTVVGPHCVLTGRTVIGNNNRLFSGAQIGVLSQDLKHRAGLIGRTQIGDNNMFREFCSISASTMEDPEDEHRVTVIGSHCLFMATTHVGHDSKVGSGVILANGAALSGHVEVQDKAILGGLAGVHQFCRIGTLAFVGGMARINMDVLPYMIVEGHPAKCYGPNMVGLQRNGFDAEARARIKAIFKIVYRSQLNTSQAIREIQARLDPTPERTVLVDFIRQSMRGLTR